MFRNRTNRLRRNHAHSFQYNYYECSNVSPCCSHMCTLGAVSANWTAAKSEGGSKQLYARRNKSANASFLYALHVTSCNHHKANNNEPPSADNGPCCRLVRMAPTRAPREIETRRSECNFKSNRIINSTHFIILAKRCPESK
jgi:hypothetical protein